MIKRLESSTRMLLLSAIFLSSLLILLSVRLNKVQAAEYPGDSDNCCDCTVARCKRWELDCDIFGCTATCVGGYVSVYIPCPPGGDDGGGTDPKPPPPQPPSPGQVTCYRCHSAGFCEGYNTSPPCPGSNNCDNCGGFNGGGGNGNGGSGDRPETTKGGEISGYVYLDPEARAVNIAGSSNVRCFLANSPGVQPGVGSYVRVKRILVVRGGGPKIFERAVNSDGSWSTGQFSSWAGEKYSAQLYPDVDNFECTCPSSCIYRRIGWPPRGYAPNFYVRERYFDPWWQAVGGDVMTDRNIASSIPTSTCTSPDCDSNLIIKGDIGSPGVAIYGSNITTPTVSTENWKAKTTYEGKEYTWKYFSNTLSSTINFNIIRSSLINANSLTSGGVEYNGYYWYKRTGDLTITGDNMTLPGNRKVILIIDGGDLNLESNIKGGFFLTIVGKDSRNRKGNINIDQDVTDLEGVFIIDDTFSTGTTGLKDDYQLTVKGVVIAWNEVKLERDLGGAENKANPSEIFEYDPEVLLNLPRELTIQKTVWREIPP